jgi:Protein of unknown function (DUF1302)
MKKKALALSVLAAISSQAGAFQFETGDDWQIRWDNSFKANAMLRTEKQNKDVYGKFNTFTQTLTSGLADDSDLSVDRGDFVSTRVDVLSEMDVIWRDDFGFRISGSAWYDYMYEDSSNRTGNATLQNGYTPADATWGALSVNPNDYTDAAQDLHYAGGELLDAFVFANWDIGDMALGFRAGRHTLYWGQTLLTAGAISGIAGAMAAIDLAKGYSVPGSEIKELFLPNTKVSGILQLTDNLTLNAFYAFEHVVHRYPEEGTYFNPAELLTEDSEFFTLAAGSPDRPRSGYRVRDDKYSDSGEWGVNVQYTIEPWNLETSFVYLNYTDRSVSGAWGIRTAVPEEEYNKFLQKSNAAIVGYYGWVYQNDNDLYGISLSKQIFDISFGMDMVYRKDAPLHPSLATAFLGRGPGFTPADFGYGDDYPGGTGDVYSVVVNGLGLMNNDWGLWDGGKWILEITAVMADKFTSGEQYINAIIHEDRWLTAIGGQFNPTWYQVRPGWDLTLPMSVGYTIDGEQSPLSNGGNEEVGNASVGAEVLINELWTVSAKYNAYFGPAANGVGGLLKDRDNISFTVKRTF